MNLKQLFDDDRAVSPVIGVILMVAITVILAAVIGTFVLGLGDQVQTTTPTASFETDYTNDTASGNDTLELTHGGGDTLTASQVTISVGEAFEDTNGGGYSSSATWADMSGESKVTAGSTVTVDTQDLSTDTVRIVWSGESGDNSAVLAKWSGPNA